MNSKAKKSINKSKIDDVFGSIYSTVKPNIQKFVGQGSSRIFDSVIDHNINTSKYDSLTGSSHIKLPKELDHLRKDLINIQKLAIMNDLNGN